MSGEGEQRAYSEPLSPRGHSVGLTDSQEMTSKLGESHIIDPEDVSQEGRGCPQCPEPPASLPGRYPLAVTKYRESELYSSSVYNQNDPWDPPVVFEEFLRNNENIEDEVLAPPSSSPGPRPDLCPSLDLCPGPAVWRANSVVTRSAHSL